MFDKFVHNFGMSDILTWYIEEMLIFNSYLCAYMASLHKKSWTVSIVDFDNTTAVIGSAEQYYDYSVLKKIDDISGGIGMPDLKLTACLAACYLVLFLTLWKG